VTGETTVRAHQRKGTRGVRQHLRVIDTGDFGVVSASKSDLTPDENYLRTKDLLKDLLLQNYKPIPAAGVYRYADGRKVREESYLVPRLREEDALALGRKYRQESVLVDDKLINTETAEPMMRFNPDHTLFDDEATRQDFSTTIIDPHTKKRVTFSLRE
jgi:hypothetical protein